jgi:hypothetical protein
MSEKPGQSANSSKRQGPPPLHDVKAGNENKKSKPDRAPFIIRLAGWIPLMLLIVGGTLGGVAIQAGTFTLLPIVGDDASVSQQILWLGAGLCACPLLSLLLMAINAILSIKGTFWQNMGSVILGASTAVIVVLVGAVLTLDLDIFGNGSDKDSEAGAAAERKPIDDVETLTDEERLITTEESSSNGVALEPLSLADSQPVETLAPLDIVKTSATDDVAAVPLGVTIPEPTPFSSYEDERPEWHQLYKLVDFNNPAPIRAIDPSWTPCAAFADAGNTLIINDGSSTLHRIDLVDYRRTHSLTLPGRLLAVQAHRDGILAVFEEPSTLVLIDSDTLEIQRAATLPDGVTQFQSSPESSVAFVASEDRFYVIDLGEWEIAHEIVRQSDYSDDLEVADLALAGITSMIVSPDGEYLYTFNQRIHRLRIDGSNLVYEESSDLNYAAQRGCQIPIQISPNGEILAVININTEVHNIQRFNFKGAVGRASTQLYDASNLKRMVRELEDGLPLTSQSLSHDSSFCFRVNPNGLHRVMYTEPNESRQVSDDLLELENIHKDHKAWYFPQAVFCHPSRKAMLVFEQNGATMYETGCEELSERLAERPEGSAFRSPQGRFAEAMQTEAEAGAATLDAEGIPLVASRTLEPAVRFLGFPNRVDLPNYVLKTPGDRNRLYIQQESNTSENALGVYSLSGESLGIYGVSEDLPKEGRMELAGNFLVHMDSAQLDEDPESEFLCHNGGEHIFKTANIGDELLELGQNLDMPEGGNYSRNIYPADFDGDGLDEFVIDGPRLDGRELGDFPGFYLYDLDQSTRPLHIEETDLIDPFILTGDTDGDQKENLFVAGGDRRRNAGFFIRLHHLDGYEDVISEIAQYRVDSYDEFERMINTPSCYIRESVRTTLSPDRGKALFVGLTLDESRLVDYQATNPRIPEVPWTNVDGFYPVWSGENSLTWRLEAFDDNGKLAWSQEMKRGLFMPLISAAPDVPYIAVSWQASHETMIFDSDTGELVGRIVGYGPEGRSFAEFFQDPETDEYILALCREKGIDLFRILDEEPASIQEGDEEPSFKIVDFKPRYGDPDYVTLDAYLANRLLGDSRFVSEGQLQPPSETDERLTLPMRDDFEGETSLDWTILNPDESTVSLEATDGCLSITPQEGRLLGKAAPGEAGLPRNIHLLELPPTGQELSVTMWVNQFNPTVAYQVCGLVFFDDKDNMLLGMLKTRADPEEGARFALVGRTDGKDQHTGLVERPEGDERFKLRIVKQGNQYRFFYSFINGVNIPVRSITWGDGTPKYVGFLTLGGKEGESEVEDTVIDSFQISELPPYEIAPLEEVAPPLAHSGLRGLWYCERVYFRGENAATSLDIEMGFRGADTGLYSFWGDRRQFRGRLTPSHVDEDTEKVVPARMEFVPVEGSEEAVEAQTLRAIVLVQGEKLTMCLNLDPGGDYPEWFETSPTDNNLLIRWKHQ